MTNETIVAHVVCNNPTARAELLDLCALWQRRQHKSMYVDGEQSCETHHDACDCRMEITRQTIHDLRVALKTYRRVDRANTDKAKARRDLADVALDASAEWIRNNSRRGDVHCDEEIEG